MSFEEFKKYHNANYHDGDSLFDERTYKKSNGDDFDCDFVQTCFDHFEAGAASRQGEINELQKRIDDALNMLDSLQEQHWKNWKEGADMMDQGASNAYEHSYWILKGESNELA